MNRDNSHPNILFIFTDQQRFDAVSAHGNPDIRTPVLDRLVREGTTFMRCYTPSPVCVAARTAIATGLPAHVNGCSDNAPMPREYPSFMERLRDSGYQTHGVGKMHFTPDHRKLWGFESRDISEEIVEEGNDFVAFLRDNDFDHVHEPNGVRSEYYYIPQPSQLPARLHETQWVADRSLDFLKRRDTSRPFFLWTSFINPHPPFESPTPWNKLYRCPDMPLPFVPENSAELLSFWNRVQNRYKYKDAGTDRFLLRTMRAAYYSCISFIDYNIGRILDALGPEAANTLIVFSSDHGELLGDYASFGKRCMLDPAVRVPLIVRWPDRVPAGRTCSTPVSLLDLWPTFVGAAGIDEPPPYVGSGSLIETSAASQRENTVVSQFSEAQFGLYMITDGRFKYIYSAADQKAWLFALEDTQPEAIDLSPDLAYAEPLSRLRGELIDRLATEGCVEAVENGAWRIYPVASFPADPDDGLLFQDPPSVRRAVERLPPEYRSDKPEKPRHGLSVFRH